MTLREKWIAALRSDNYKQSDGYLEHNGYYCCLGVLAAVIGDDSAFARTYSEEEDVAEYLPVSVLSDDIQANLARMNDSCGLTFRKIADYIEAHPEIDPKWPPEGA